MEFIWDEIDREMATSRICDRSTLEMIEMIRQHDLDEGSMLLDLLEARVKARLETREGYEEEYNRVLEAAIRRRGGDPEKYHEWCRQMEAQEKAAAEEAESRED